jgi:hypothetical protein
VREQQKQSATHVVAQGSPEHVVKAFAKSHTASVLRPFLAERGKTGAM